MFLLSIQSLVVQVTGKLPATKLEGFSGQTELVKVLSQ